MKPLLCRLGWHLWTRWAMPPGWRLLEQRTCQRYGCRAVERRHAKTGKPVEKGGA